MNVKMHGNTSAKVLIIGEAPGEVESVTNIPMSGPQGGVLYRQLKNILPWPETMDLFKWPNKASSADYAQNKLHFNNFIEQRDSLLEARKNYIAVTNAVSFWPKDLDGKTRRPTRQEINANLESLESEISSLPNLKLIIACGKSAKYAIEALCINDKYTYLKIEKVDHTRNWNLKRNSSDITAIISELKSIFQ